MPRSHRSPAYPGTHAHDHRCEHAANVHKPSRHEPPLRHGEDAHSCLSAHTVWLPPLGTVSYPGWHVHSCVPGPMCMQVARKASQLFSALVHGSVSTSQSVPPQDVVHVHTYAATISVHVPALPHGNEAHSSWSCSQLSWPAKPAEQVHTNACTRSKHVPPCKHGADAHSSTSMPVAPIASACDQRLRVGAIYTSLSTLRSLRWLHSQCRCRNTFEFGC